MQNIKYKGQGEKLKDEKSIWGIKKEVLLFYLLMIAVIGWFVVAETVYPSERIKASDRRILHTGGHLPGKEINDDHYGQKRIISD